MNDLWSYQKKRFVDRRGRRWHFMFLHRYLPDRPAGESVPFALYFRNEERTKFGVLSFDRAKDNPYRDLALMTRKIMNDLEFQSKLLDPTSEVVWK